MYVATSTGKLAGSIQIYGKSEVSTPGLGYNGWSGLVEIVESVADICLKGVF